MNFKINDSHWTVLIDFMEKHKSFARGQFTGPTGKGNQRRLWEELSLMLNSLGHGSRPVGKWQKSWADIKYSIKKKAAFNKKEIAATGGGPEIGKTLKDWEERVLAILGKTFYEGVGAAECGVPGSPSTSATIVLDEIDVNMEANVSSEPCLEDIDTDVSEHKEEEKEITIIPEDHCYVSQSKGKKRKRQVDKENELYEESIRELKRIRNSVDCVKDALIAINVTLNELKDTLSK